ncbi:hypothetical protein XFF6166_840057 [Xanthomonas citri pv. fuscans]|nr:hypothetical protein XFF6166_840057 [Xanthomonas citri pv. fuscans]SON98398.1 hypothetical protein XFF7767_1030056 [Xanthomonas citri pv. fuscans]SOO02563.1 hypothetical protein XFF6960_630100 [Xanthomonas citri pv. fuscans]SOO12866.1 hypothetical protein XFF7766_1140057 [Xanthomonas citri pv. fuscans]SOO42338.1 hypothetical protein XFF1815_180056 [Xanthomonas citri pv. fuscans]
MRKAPRGAFRVFDLRGLTNAASDFQELAKRLMRRGVG